jgi:hypothetical protein
MTASNGERSPSCVPELSLASYFSHPEISTDLTKPLKIKLMLRTTVSRPVCLGVKDTSGAQALICLFLLLNNFGPSDLGTSLTAEYVCI